MKRQPLQDTFFMLTPDVRDRLLEIKLTAAEWRVWCYLVSLDPFGDRGAKFSPAELMLKCSIKKTTYFSAKAKFQKLGLFDFRDGVTKVVNLQTSLEQTTSGYSQQAEIIESEISESEFGNSESRSLKPLASKASKSPQTIQTYLDFKDSLSERERENFLKFVEDKIKNLEKPINDKEAWLASKNAAKQNRWEVYYERFKIEGTDKNALQKELEAKQRAIANFKNRHNLKNEEIEGNKLENQENRGEAQSKSIGEGRASAEFTKLNNLPDAEIEPKNSDSERDDAEALEKEARKRRAIANFQKHINRDLPVDEPEPENTNEQEYRRSLAAFDELLSSALGEKEKSLAQQHREKIARAKQQQQELARQRREAAARYSSQLDPDLQRRKEIKLREIEEFNQRDSQRQNHEIISKKPENE